MVGGVAMESQATFSGWAVVEIMGHNREVGFVTTEYFGGPALFRVDQPELPAREYELKRAQWIGDKLCPIGTKVERQALPGKTAYVGPASIFRLTPCTEETARKAVEELIPAPIKILSIPERAQITSGEEPDGTENDADPDFQDSELEEEPF